MNVRRASLGRARPAPAHFPYEGHGTLADVWAGRRCPANAAALPQHKRFCRQCERAVTKAEAESCCAPFCKGRTA
jgi:hypothetical protein